MESRARRLLDPVSPCEPADLNLLTFSGELLPDWYEEWIVPERDRIHQLRLHALEALCRRFLDAGRFSEAVEAGLVAVSAEPLRESGRRLLIEVYLAEGNVAQAIGQYTTYRTLLLDELGVEPTSEIQELVARVRLAKGSP
jgi:DNA-binding SARP family transcriptional activator